MEILFSIIAAILIGAFLLSASNRVHSWVGNAIEFSGLVLIAVSSGALIVFLVSVPANRMKVHAHIAEMRAIQETAAAFRADGADFEDAAFQLRVAEANQLLARAKFYNGTIFDIWIPDEVEDIEPIR